MEIWPSRPSTKTNAGRGCAAIDTQGHYKFMNFCSSQALMMPILFVRRAVGCYISRKFVTCSPSTFNIDVPWDWPLPS